MNAQHTPGPWYVRPDDPYPWVVYAEPSLTICDVRNAGPQISEANARLIAAAPELLAVLRGVIQNAGHAIDTEWLERAMVAIAAAEGRRP